jgi:nitrite reductase (NADH) small subunit
MKWTKVCRKSEIPQDTGKLVELDGLEIALFSVEGKVYAIYSPCSHRGGPLAEGGLHGKTVMCPWHGWEFDVTTGVCTFNDQFKQTKFDVKEEGEDIYVKV